MSVKKRKRDKNQKRIHRATAEVLRLERVITQYHEKLPKLEDRLAGQKKQLEEAEKNV